MSVQLEKKTRRPAPMTPDPQRIAFAEACTWYGVPVAEMDRDELMMVISWFMQDLEARRIEESRRRSITVGQYL